MKYTNNLSSFYRNSFFCLTNVALGPITLGTTAGALLSGVAAELAGAKKENTVTAAMVAGGIIGGTAGGFIGCPFTVPPALIGGLVFALTTLITYPCALALDLCSFVFNKVSELVSTNKPESDDAYLAI